ncbi:MAG: GlxA family transcriptional regulator, partial [Boseongicola sp.]
MYADLAITMRDWTKPNRSTASFTFVLFDQFSNQVFANALEPLRAANTFLRRPAYTWQILSLDGQPVTSSAGMTVVPDGPLDGSASGSALILLPSYGYREIATATMSRLLRSAATRFDALIGIDGGAWALAVAGLLDGRQATIHFDEFDEFAETFPAINAKRERWIDDGDRKTSGGAVTAFEMMMHLITRTHGTALTLRIASLFAVADTKSPGPLEPPGGDRRIRRALSEMEASIERPIPIGEIAKRTGCRQKDLERRFKRTFGASPRKVYQRIRLDAALNLVEYTSLDLAEIATRTGYNNASAFT